MLFPAITPYPRSSSWERYGLSLILRFFPLTMTNLQAELWHPHGLSNITGNSGLSGEEIGDDVLEVFKFGHLILL